jgi:hypothetical protein
MLNTLSIATAQKLSEIYRHRWFSVDTTDSQSLRRLLMTGHRGSSLTVAHLYNKMRSETFERRCKRKHALYVLVCAAFSRQGHISPLYV